VSGDGFLTHLGNDKKQGTGGLLLRMLLRWFFYRQKEKSAQIFGGIKFYTYICTQKGVYADVIDYIWTEILLLFG
jgi:hypothetical protein